MKKFPRNEKFPRNVFVAAAGFSRLGALLLLLSAGVPAAFLAAEGFRAETPADRMAYAARAEDSDGDGLPDSAELALGFDPDDPADGLSDADGDGLSLAQEWILGTDPNDAGDPPSGAAAWFAAFPGSASGEVSGAGTVYAAGKTNAPKNRKKEKTMSETNDIPVPVSVPAPEPAPEPETSGSFSSDGSRGSVSRKISFSGGSPTGPAWSANYTLSVPAGNIYSISVSADDSATVSGEGISAESHWNAASKSIVGGSATSEYKEIPSGAGEVSFGISYSNAGGPYSLSVTVTSTRCPSESEQPRLGDGDEKCKCPCQGQCDMAANTDIQSVRFEQPFGRTPFAAGVPAGTLVLKKETATGDLFSPLGLKYDHYLTRRVTSKDAGTQSASVSADGLWENVYENGVPAASNAWKSSRVRVNADGSVTEFLSDRTEISYDASGDFVSVKSPAGVVLTASQLGVKVVRDAGTGALRQIWSLADGLLDIVPTDDERYEIRWYKNGDFSGEDASGLFVPAGTPVKIFACGAPAGTTNVFSITEKRGAEFSFESRWTFDPLNNAWVFDRGNEVRISRAWTKNDAGNFVVTETKTTPATNARAASVMYSEEEISPANGNRLVGKSVGGVAEYTATRVTSGNGLGKPATETDRAGTTRAYVYDAEGRVSRETLSRGFGGLVETTEYAYAATPSGAFPDPRPRTVVHKIAGTVFTTETFSYDDDSAGGRTETRSVTAAGTTLTSETRYYPANAGTVAAGRVKLEIREDGTATFREYSSTGVPASVGVSSDLGYTETVTEGVFADGAFAPVPGKSTRVVRVFDSRGNETRTENHAHTGAAFELVSWENRTYSPAHKVISTTRSDGKTTSADYICTGPVWTIDADGVRTDNTFDSAKRLASSTRHGARGDVTTTYAYDAEGRVVRETRTAGTLSATTLRAYDARGELVSETDALGKSTTYSISDDGLTETVTFPDGGTRVTRRNADGSLASVTGTAVVAKHYVYSFDAENALKITTVFTGGEDSPRWEKTYADGHGRTVKTERPGFGDDVVLTTENAYAGTRLVSTAATGQPGVAYAHDAFGAVISTTRSAGGAWNRTETDAVFEKDSEGVIWKKTTTVVSCSDASIPARTSVSRTRLSALSPALESEQVEIDARGNATRTTGAYDSATKTRTTVTTFPQTTGAQTSVAVDGAVVSRTSPSGVSTSSSYDALSRKFSDTDARGNVVNYAYDAADHLVSETRTIAGAAATTAFEYDALGRRKKITYPDGTYTATAYDARGNVLAEYGNAAYPVKFAYDAFGQKTQMRTFRALAGAPESPDALDDDAGDLTTWTYDAATGALLSKTDAAGASVNYVYTATGLLASRAWSRGVSTACAYDAWNRLVSTTYSDGTAGVSQAYDALGRLVSVTDGSGTKTFAYDAYGSLVSESDAALNASLARGLDAYGREISLTATRGGEPFALFARSWDAATGRLSGCAYGNVEFAYGRLAGTDLLSEIAVMGGYVMTKRVGYAADRDLPVEIAYEKSDASLIAKRTYSHDALGRVSARTQTRGSAAARSDSFGYNARSELTSATLGSDAYAYAFDYIGNRSTATEKDASLSYVTNNLNQYTSRGEAAFLPLPENPSESDSEQSDRNVASPLTFSPTYDLDGNATLVQTSTGTWSISYNGENRPIRFENAATQTVVECAYDSQGRRFEKKVTVAGTLTLHERYVYDGYLQIAAFDVSTDAEGTESFALKRVIFWDPEEPTATRPLAINVLGDNLYFPTVDLTKNVCELVDFYGDVAATYDYAPFGAVTAGTPSGSAVPANPFQFSSEVYDSELGLVYYNYRHYSPTDGRFLSRDPIEEQGGRNLYAFLRNSVMRGNDFGGLVFDKEACRKLMEKIQDLGNKLRRELDKYNPIEDGKGGFSHKYGTTKPGGHYTEIKNLQNGLKNNLKNWKDVCKDDDNNPPCSPPYPAWADQLSNKHIPEPIYATHMSKKDLWEAFVIGAGVGVSIAIIGGQSGPQVFIPEEVVTVPISAIVGGIVGVVKWIE